MISTTKRKFIPWTLRKKRDRAFGTENSRWKLEDLEYSFNNGETDRRRNTLESLLLHHGACTETVILPFLRVVRAPLCNSRDTPWDRVVRTRSASFPRPRSPSGSHCNSEHTFARTHTRARARLYIVEWVRALFSSSPRSFNIFPRNYLNGSRRPISRPFAIIKPANIWTNKSI